MILLIALLACSGGDDPSGDSGLTDTGGDDDPCATAPVVTWDNFGQGFMTENCQACHASTSSNRRGAPAEVTFDDYQSVLDQRERILARAVGDTPTMPPLGGVNEEDRYLLDVWLTCWEETP